MHIIKTECLIDKCRDILEKYSEAFILISKNLINTLCAMPSIYLHISDGGRCFMDLQKKQQRRFQM